MTSNSITIKTKKRGHLDANFRSNELSEHLLGGVDRPDTATVYVDGHNIYHLNENELAIFRRRNIGIVYQFYNLFPTLTADENIQLPCLLDNRLVDKKRISEILAAIISAVPL